MEIKLGFLGAAMNVTGSRHFVEVDGLKVLVDCGLYQERQFLERNWDPFPIPPGEIDMVLLTHAHLDHCGLLPKLVREGFRGKIYCTTPTAQIAQIILLDSAHIQEEDAAYKLKRHKREGRKGPRPVKPLYTTEDAEAVLPRFAPVDYGKPVRLSQHASAVFCDAGHVFGSSVISLSIHRDGERRTILFSGDLGRHHKPILDDPAVVDGADYVLIESTYGNRVHEPVECVQNRLAEVINEAVTTRGNIVIPSFALERAQDILYHLNALLIAKRIPALPIFLDSPMAIRITEVFKNHPGIYDTEMADLVRNSQSPFELPNLKMTQSTEESKAINHLHEPAIIIAGSGMCTGGRIKHHLSNNISQRENTILFIGYQAVGTLGRKIVDGAREVRIFGKTRTIEARIERIGGFSAHADREELLAWLQAMKKPPRRVFVVHGEEQAARQFGSFLQEKTGWNVTVPAYKDEILLD